MQSFVVIHVNNYISITTHNAFFHSSTLPATYKIQCSCVSVYAPVLCNVIVNAGSISWFSRKLEERGLISFQTRVDVETMGGYSPSEKCDHLLNAVNFSDPEALDTFLEVLRDKPALHPFAELLARFHRKSV